MVGCVGDDEHGHMLTTKLEQAGVDIGGVMVTTGSTSGTALIAVDARGENAIIVSPDRAADIVRTVWDILVQAVQSLGRFFDVLINS